MQRPWITLPLMRGSSPAPVQATPSAAPVSAPVEAPPTPPTPKPPLPTPAPNEAADRFERTQAKEQAANYGVGGIVEGIGKYYQRVGRGDGAAYQEHPLAAWFFGPLFSATVFVGETLTGEKWDEDAARDFFKQTGSWLMGAGNLVKVVSNFWAGFQYKKLAKSLTVAPNAAGIETVAPAASGVADKIVKKASEGNSFRNWCYITEKACWTLAGGLYLVGDNYPSIALMAVAQSAVLVNSIVSMNANWGLVRNSWRNPSNLAMVRDACKITSLNLTKGLWATTTLGAFAFMNLSENIRASLPLAHWLGVDSVPTPQNTTDLYDILVQASWELPDPMIWAGVALMVVPPALTLGLNLKHAAKGGSGSAEKGDKTDRVYHLASAGVDVMNGIGGYFTAHLFWQPLGAVFNGLGAAGSYFLTGYKRRLNTPPEAKAAAESPRP